MALLRRCLAVLLCTVLLAGGTALTLAAILCLPP